MKTAFISRFGGLGDVLHASHLPKLIKEYYKVDHITLETNYQGYQIFQNNPFVDNLIHVDIAKLTDNRLRKNWDWAEETYDLSFNLIYTIEQAVCCNEDDSKYYRDSKYRRENFGKMSYYDVMTKACNIPEEYYGTRGMMYYPVDEHNKAVEYLDGLRAKHNTPKLVLINLSGTSLHKKFVQAESVARKILEARKDVLIILTGDEHCKMQEFTGDRIVSWVAKKNIRTVALLTKYLDLTISLESGLPLIAHSWDAPCLHLLTAASPENHCMYANNAHWIQAPVACSPCHKNPREYWGCPVKDKMPGCVWFNEDEVVEKALSIIQ